MNEHEQRLRQAAEEIRKQGHTGWGNTCEWSADEIKALTAHVDQLGQALHEYGQHHDSCSYHGADDPDTCDCGYNEAFERPGTA